MSRRPLPVDDIDSRTYEVKLELRRLYHQCLADVLDPGRVFSSTLILSSMMGRKFQPLIKPNTATASKYFTTSLPVKAALSDAKSPDLIKVFRRGPEPYVLVPGELKL